MRFLVLTISKALLPREVAAAEKVFVQFVLNLAPQLSGVRCSAMKIQSDPINSNFVLVISSHPV